MQVVTFQRKTKPSPKTIWEAIGKPKSVAIRRITRVKQPWELPYWVIEYEIKE